MKLSLLPNLERAKPKSNLAPRNVNEENQTFGWQKIYARVRSIFSAGRKGVDYPLQLIANSSLKLMIDGEVLIRFKK